MKIKNLIYCLLCLSFSIIIGAAVYEHLVIIPSSFAAPPLSLQMFQGDYGVNGGTFWRKIHPIVLSLFVICLVMVWKTERKLHVLIPFIGYLIVLAITATYFVPELLDIVNTQFSEEVDQSLVKRGMRWEMLSLVRLFFIIALVIFMYLGLTKSPEKIN